MRDVFVEPRDPVNEVLCTCSSACMLVHFFSTDHDIFWNCYNTVTLLSLERMDQAALTHREQAAAALFCTNQHMFQ